MNNYRSVLASIEEKALSCGRNPAEITLITVTKNQPVPTIQEVYDAGCRHFGESRVQEVLPKLPCLPADCKWHFIGTLQANKVGKVLPYFSLIHSVDSLELAQRISRLSQNMHLETSILLEVNTSLEKSKHGLKQAEWEDRLDDLNKLPNIRVEGLMTMAPLTDDQIAIRHCFKTLCQLRDKWQSRMKDPAAFRHLSMGMSHDYLLAIEEGATLLRIGTSIFSQQVC